MSNYRRGAIFGLTVAEMFILLTFILLIALLGLIQSEESGTQADTKTSARVWMRPEEIQTLVSAAEKAQIKAALAYAAVEQERNLARKTIEETRRSQEMAELARAAAESERDRALEMAEEAQIEAELAHDAVGRERNLAHKKIEDARREVELASSIIERERDQALRDLELFRQKGENPPCWYEVINTGDGKMRERRLYVFKVAIYEDGIELGKLTPPPGGAVDDSDDTYANEWVRLQLGDLPYGKRLDGNEFEDAVRYLHEKGKNRQVRTYECVFSVRVWDETPDHAKERWQYAHDELIERFFNAYTMKDLKWEDIE